MQSKKTYIKNISWVLLDNIIKIIGGLIVGVWVANHLGDYNYGRLSYALVYRGMFFFLIEIGFVQVLVKELINNPMKKDSLIGSSIGVKLIGAVLSFILANTISQFTIDDPIIRKMILILSIHFFTLTFDTFNSYFQFKVQEKFRIIAHIFSLVISSIIKVYFILYNFPLEYFALSYVIDFVISSILKAYFYSKSGNDLLKLKVELKVIKYLVISSWTIGLSMFLVRVLLQIDRLMIGNLLDNSKLGIYSVSTDLTDPISVLSYIVTSSLVTYLMSLKKENEVFYKKRLNQVLNIFSWLSIIICIFFSLSSKLIISILYSNEYFEAYLPFAINVFSLLFIFQLSILNIWLINENLQRYQLYITSLSVILNIIGNYILIPKLGISGAAISTIISRASMLWIFPLFFKEIKEISWVLIRSLNPLELSKSVKSFYTN